MKKNKTFQSIIDRKNEKEPLRYSRAIGGKMYCTDLYAMHVMPTELYNGSYDYNKETDTFIPFPLHGVKTENFLFMEKITQQEIIESADFTFSTKELQEIAKKKNTVGISVIGITVNHAITYIDTKYLLKCIQFMGESVTISRIKESTQVLRVDGIDNRISFIAQVHGEFTKDAVKIYQKN